MDNEQEKSDILEAAFRIVGEIKHEEACYSEDQGGLCGCGKDVLLSALRSKQDAPATPGSFTEFMALSDAEKMRLVGKPAAEPFKPVSEQCELEVADGARCVRERGHYGPHDYKPAAQPSAEEP